MNGPEAGTIKVFLVNEEYTVTVGQDLVRIELGGAPSGDNSKPAASESEEPAKKEEEPKQPAPEKPAEPESKPEPKAQASKPAPQEKKEAPAKQSSQPSQPPKDPSSSSALGSRDERKVGLSVLLHRARSVLIAHV